jgi:hypothetical protein
MRVNEQRTVAARLGARIADQVLNAQAWLAWHWMDNVEKIFLSSGDKRWDAAAEARWLDTAEGAFQIALRKVRDVEQLVEKYNPPAGS